MPDGELLARMEVVGEQMLLAVAETVLLRAAYERARDDHGGRNGSGSHVAELAVPAIRRPLSGALAAAERFRLWAEELDGMHREALVRGLLPGP